MAGGDGAVRVLALLVGGVGMVAQEESLDFGPAASKGHTGALVRTSQSVVTTRRGE